MSQSFENSGSNAPFDDASVFVPVLNEARLLVVADEESLRITTAAIFEKEGYIVDTASSGDEAIDLLGKTDYDLVLTDLHMEGGDGLSVLNQIRRHAPLTISVVLNEGASLLLTRFTASAGELHFRSMKSASAFTSAASTPLTLARSASTAPFCSSA